MEPATVNGEVRIPGSKSHTIRALLIAAAAEGRSVIEEPLDSSDTRSALELVKALGAKVEEIPGKGITGSEIPDEGIPRGSDKPAAWVVTGTGGRFREGSIDVGNSGTSLYLAAAMAATGGSTVRFDGDGQIRRRSAAPLLQALGQLGVRVDEFGREGCAPFAVTGPLKGGRVSMECRTSQYLSALLLAAPLAPEGSSTELEIPLLYEAPYAEMTLRWLSDQGIRLERQELRRFSIPGGQHYSPFRRAVPGDFSSATFFFCAPAVAGGRVSCLGLDRHDVQGDKAVLDILSRMGCPVEELPDSGGIRVSAPAGGLSGGEFDLNDIPDALPALAATACFARGKTRLVNVPQARIKETDRIAVMARELNRLGGRVTELPDGLEIEGGGQGSLKGGEAAGHGDHRVIMALAIAALGARDRVVIDDDQAVSVTFPNFFHLLETIRTM